MPKILLFCFWFLWGAGGGLQNQSVTLSCFRANQCKQSKLAVMTFILKEAATSGFLVQLAAAQLGWRKFPVSEDTWFPTQSIYDWQPERERGSMRRRGITHPKGKPLLLLRCSAFWAAEAPELLSKSKRSVCFWQPVARLVCNIKMFKLR